MGHVVINYGINGEQVLSYLPQIDVAADAPVTTARLAEIIDRAASELNAAIRYTYGPSAPDTINADTHTELYRRAGEIVCFLALPAVWMAAHHGADAPDWIVDQAADTRDQIRRNLGVFLGYLPSNDAAQNVAASAGSLSASGTDGENRRQFDGRAGGRTEGGFVY